MAVFDGVTQWIVTDRVSETNSLQYGLCECVNGEEQKSKYLEDRQTPARGRVFTCGTETGIAHGSCDFLIPLLVTLW